MKRKLLVGLVTLCTAAAMNMPVYANNCSDTALPSKFVAYTTFAQTGLRDKTDTTSHYIKNTSGFDLWIYSYNKNDVNCTVNRYAIIPSGTERFIRNTIYEKGYRQCKLDISSAMSGVSGTVSGKWSPDSVGSYPNAN